MRVLVTGSEGFVGRHFFHHYDIQNRTEVLGLDIRDSRKPVDVRDFFRYSDVHVDLLIHCAAVVGGRVTIERSPLDVAVDLAIDAEMVQWALRTRPGRVVYFSSSAAYPTWMQMGARSKRLREHDIGFTQQIGAPDMSYGWAKLTGEYQCQLLAAEGVEVFIFRPFSGYGPGQSLDYPFPSFIGRAARHEDPFTIWGNGQQIRDFIHISDIVGGVLAALEQDMNEPLNLGTGVPTSFNELAKMVCAQVGYAPVPVHFLDHPVGVRCRVANTERLEVVYTPRVALEDGIAEALEEL